MCGYASREAASCWFNILGLWDGELKEGKHKVMLSQSNYNLSKERETEGEASVQACHTGGLWLPP